MTNNDNKYNQRIYHLDELILDLYNAAYAKNGRYKIKYIDVSDLKLERFKTFDYDLDIIFDVTDVAYQGKFPTGMERINQTAEGLNESIVNSVNIDQYLFKRRGEIYKSMIRIIPYSSSDVLENMSDPVNVNQIIKTLLSELVVSEKSNNLILPIINVDVKGEDLLRFEIVKPLIDPNQYYSIEITEKFYLLTTLDNFLKEYALDASVLKYIIYQAVDVLYQINTMYPGFRYNQFFPEMVDCYIKKVNDTFYPEIKLSNYFLSEIEEIVSNDYLKNPNIPEFRTTYGDLYQILNNLWNNNYNDIKKYPEIVDIFNKILPEKIRSKEKYLSIDLWNQLSDEEKDDLKIKNIRNLNFFTKDLIPKNGFINGDKTETSVGGSEDSLDNDDDDMDLTEQRLDMGNESPDDNMAEAFSPNKKYYNNDIDNMSNKKSNNNSYRSDTSNKNRKNTSSKKNLSTDNSYSETERTEDMREFRNKPSRIVDVSDTNVGSRKSNNNSRVKSYRGTRQIGNNNNNVMNQNDLKYLLGNSNSQNNNAALLNNNTALLNNNNNTQSRINSLGALLGTNPNDINTNRKNNIDISQMIQQMQQQPGQPEINYQLPGNLPPNQTSQIPLQIQNPSLQAALPQPQQQQIDNDALMRYLMATNQMQTQNIPQANLQNNAPQMDQNMLAAMLMQQMQQQTPQQQTLQLPQQMALQGLLQNGGSKQNPFFFQ